MHCAFDCTLQEGKCEIGLFVIVFSVCIHGSGVFGILSEKRCQVQEFRADSGVACILRMG